MNSTELNKIRENLTTFMATYIMITQPKIPNYTMGEDAWQLFLGEAIEKWFSKQKKFDDMQLVEAEKPSSFAQQFGNMNSYAAQTGMLQQSALQQNQANALGAYQGLLQQAQAQYIWSQQGVQ